MHIWGQLNTCLAQVLEPAGGAGRQPESLLMDEFYAWLTVGPTAEPPCSGRQNLRPGLARGG